jgi:hypothetical protein
MIGIEVGNAMQVANVSGTVAGMVVTTTAKASAEHLQSARFAFCEFLLGVPVSGRKPIPTAARNGLAWLSAPRIERRRSHPVFTISITAAMDDNHRASRYTAGPVTRREWKTVVLTAVERSGRALSLWAAGEGPASTGRWFASLTDVRTGGHVHLSSVTELRPDGMVDDLVTQLTNPERTKRLTRARRRVVMSGEQSER